MNARPFDIGADGRIIGIANVTSGGERAGDSAQAEMRVIVNWFDELKQRVPVK
jgi:hypothetical protein